MPDKNNRVDIAMLLFGRFLLVFALKIKHIRKISTWKSVRSITRIHSLKKRNSDRGEEKQKNSI